MAEATIDQRGFTERNLFLVRRLHSLCGIVPIGVFLCIHLTINFTVIFGGSRFQSAVDGIHLLDKVGLLYPVEIVGIFIPLAFHAILGIQIWLTGQQNMLIYTYGASIRYALQRWTAILVLLFVVLHLWHVHWLGKPFRGGNFDPHDAHRTAVLAIQSSWFYAPAYLVGLLCAVFHFCNGIWTLLITWGITISREAQRRVGCICLVLGVGLAILGLSSLFTLKHANPNDLGGPPHETSHVADITPSFSE